jgi:DNA transposition AAA+ family ATPase
MALTTVERTALLARSLPQSEATRARLQDYLWRSSLEASDFARRINYSKPTIVKFLSGKYADVAGNDRNIIAAVTDFMERNPIAPATEVTGEIYKTKNFLLLEKCFNYALGHSDIAVVEGDPATQKTFTMKYLIAQLNRRELAKNGTGKRAHYVYCRQSIRPTDLLKRMAESCGSLTVGGADRVLRNMRFDLRKRGGTLFCLDEVQHLDTDALETVREINDEAGCGILLAGSHEFGRFLDLNAIKLEQWHSRTHMRERLPGLNANEAEEVVRKEMGARVSQKFIDTAIQGALVDHLRSKDEKSKQYISIRRLVKSLRALKEAA